MESVNKPLDETKTVNETMNSNQTETLNDNVFDTQTDANTKSKPNIKDKIIGIKSKLQSIQITNMIFIIIIIILIIIIVVLVIYRPKIDTELLAKTQKLYEKTKIENNELQNKIHKLNENNKTLMGINSNLMNENNSLKSQSFSNNLNRGFNGNFNQNNCRSTYTRVKANVVKQDDVEMNTTNVNTPKITEVPSIDSNKVTETTNENTTIFNTNSNINSNQIKHVEDELNVNDIINQ